MQRCQRSGADSCCCQASSAVISIHFLNIVEDSYTVHEERVLRSAIIQSERRSDQ